MTLGIAIPLTIIRGEQSEYPVGAVDIAEGSMLGDDASGYCRELVVGDPFRGHSMENIQNSAGSPGDQKVKCLTGRYRLEVTITGVAITDVGKDVYASDRSTYTLTAGSNSRVGVVSRYVTTDTAIVEFQTIGSIPSRINFRLTTLVAGEENIDKINLTFSGTGGPKRGLYAIGEISGAGHATYGMWKFRTYLSAAASAAVHTVCANLHLKADAELADAGEYGSSPIYATIETDGDAAPDLRGGSLAAIYVGYYVKESGGAPVNAHVMSINTGVLAAMGAFDGLLKLQNAGDIGDYASTGGAPALATGDIMIPIKIANSTFYLVALQDSGL